MYEYSCIFLENLFQFLLSQRCNSPCLLNRSVKDSMLKCLSDIDDCYGQVFDQGA